MQQNSPAGPDGGPAFLFPEDPVARSEWIVGWRGPRSGKVRREGEPLGVLWEDDWMAGAGRRHGLTVFLANRECPWHCLMCDLWRESSPGRVSGDDILAQIDAALSTRRGQAMDWIKLYNAGSFFDQGAVPASIYESISSRCAGVRRIIVESHPSLVGERVERFLALLPSGVRLEVAMGLETVHERAHTLLNKRTVPDDFARAAARLRRLGVGVRIFVLTSVPFIPWGEAREWFLRSVDYGLEIGGDPVVVIPTRAGNGAMDRLRDLGMWRESPLEWVEAAMLHGRRRRLGRVLADTWGMAGCATDDPTLAVMRDRIEALNRLP